MWCLYARRDGCCGRLVSMWVVVGEEGAYLLRYDSLGRERSEYG